MAKRKKSRVGWLVAAVAVLGVGVLGFATGGFLDWDKESMKDRFVPKTELAVKKVEIGGLIPAAKATITKSEGGVHVIGGEIPLQAEETEELGVGHYLELKFTLKHAMEATALQVTHGEQVTVLGEEDEWLPEKNILKETKVSYVVEVDELDYVLLFDQDGDFTTEEDQVLITITFDEEIVLGVAEEIFEAASA